MKKIVFTLVLLLFTAPAWAATTVIIDANQVGDTNQVVITYEVVLPDVNLPRGFGLDITVSDGNIVACIPYMAGECTADVGNRGFGIFPSTIVIDPAPPQAEIIYVGNPVSIVQPALGGLDTNGITIELGSLYQEPNAPPSSGVLCTIVITKSCIVRIKGNAARCGEGSEPLGVVMEDETEIPNVVFGDANVIYVEGPGPCIPSDHPDYDDWVLLGEPNSWCNKRQCHGDADGILNEYGRGNFAWVSNEDIAILVAGFREIYVDAATSPWIAADFDRRENEYGRGNFARVSTEDINILVAYFREPTVLDDCQP